MELVDWVARDLVGDPAERRAAARAAADDYLESLQQRRGRLRFATVVRYRRAETT
jgi:hypothetical protein